MKKQNKEIIKNGFIENNNKKGNMKKETKTLKKCSNCGSKEFKIDFTSETNYEINKKGILTPISDNNLGMSGGVVCSECGADFSLFEFNLFEGSVKRKNEVQNEI